MKRIRSINEIMKYEFINKLKDQLHEQYYYTSRVVKIYYSCNTIYFKLKTRLVNVNYINEFISNIDKNYVNRIFKKSINFVINVC